MERMKACADGGKRVTGTQIVRCNSCGRWIGREEDLGQCCDDDREYCPRCRCTEALMDVDYGCKFDDQDVETLWEIFGDIPVNDNDEIEEEFLGFPEGTDRMDIWLWFDENHTKGAAYLMERRQKWRQK